MTWTECPKCHKATFAYGDECDHCGAGLGDTIQPLFGVGGGPREHFICRKCDYVNEPEEKECKNCGKSLPRSFQMRLEELKQAVKENIEDAEAYREMGVLYQRHNYTGEALEALEQAVSLNPNDGDSHHRLAGIYNNLARCEEAIRSYENSHRLGKEDSRTRYLLGFNYEAMGRFPEAMSAYKRAIALDSYHALSRYSLGLLLIKTGDRKGAREQCNLLAKSDSRLGQKLFDALKE